MLLWKHILTVLHSHRTLLCFPAPDSLIPSRAFRRLLIVVSSQSVDVEILCKASETRRVSRSHASRLTVVKKNRYQVHTSVLRAAACISLPISRSVRFSTTAPVFAPGANLSGPPNGLSLASAVGGRLDRYRRAALQPWPRLQSSQLRDDKDRAAWVFWPASEEGLQARRASSLIGTCSQQAL